MNLDIFKRITKYCTIYDLALIIFIIVTALIMLIIPFFKGSSFNSSEKLAKIIIIEGNSTFKKIPMFKTYRKNPFIIEIEGPIGSSKIALHQGEVWMKKAPKKDPKKLCEKIGKIKQIGPRLVCVPNNISIWIKKIDKKTQSN